MRVDGVLAGPVSTSAIHDHDLRHSKGGAKSIYLGIDALLEAYRFLSQRVSIVTRGREWSLIKAVTSCAGQCQTPAEHWPIGACLSLS